MSKEIPDDLAAWRTLFRAPDALPGQGLADKDATWDKLFERLNSRPHRRLSGYRIAAACILVLLIPATRLLRERPASSKGTPVAEKVRPVLPVARPQGPGPTHPPVTGMAPVSGTFVEARQAKKPAIRERVATSRLAAAPRPAAATQPAPAILTPTPPPSRLQAAAIESAPPNPSKPAPKKQWKVVDFNELEPGHDHPQGMVADRQFRPLRLGIDIGKN